MTECENAPMRDLLPDFVAESLGAAESARVASHLLGCSECEAEVRLLRVARAVRPQAVHVDVAAIVARLLAPNVADSRPPLTLHSSPMAPTHAAASSTVVDIHSAKGRRTRRGIWQFAASIGLIVVGGWSVMLARSGGIGLLTGVGATAGQLSDTPVSVAPSVRSGATNASAPLADSNGAVANVGAAMREGKTVATADVIGTAAAVVSVGNLSDYTDAELQRLLDRLERWDGASSGDVMPTLPIVPVGTGSGHQ